MFLSEFFSPTADEQSKLPQALKKRVLLAIDFHFVALPETVTNIDCCLGEPNYLQLLDYSVQATEEGEAHVTELRADGFSYETHSDASGRDDYATLGMREVIDLLRALEVFAGSGA